MTRKGILLSDNGDLLITNGNLTIGDSDDQNVTSILSAVKGEIKENPLLGVGLINYVNKQNNNLEQLKREVSVNLKADGYNIDRFSLDESGGFSIDYKLG